MCGICGAIGINAPESLRAAVQSMTAAMRHRGPDSQGFLVAPPAGLGMDRLSIIDLPGGHQPLWNEDRTVAAFCNGEIYNFRELRTELEPLGHRFRTNSDTEAIVHAYEQWGQDCVRHLRGMFALALLEMPSGPQGPAHGLFLARDRLGIKPLYYTSACGAFLFASEVRALLASGRTDARLSLEGLHSFLLFGSVGEPLTLLEGVFSLPPGHSLYIPLNFQQVPAPKSYWHFPAFAASLGSEPGTSADAAARLRAQLQEAMRLHLIADVTLGIFLSSGIDSSTLAALACGLRDRVRTFTVVFEEQEFSEAAKSRRTAQGIGSEHSEVLLTGAHLRARLPQAIDAFDQPSMDGINTYFVSWAATQAGLKVALSGLGSDEIFGGYPTFASVPRLQRLTAAAKGLPSPLRAGITSALRVAASLRSHSDASRKLAAAWSAPQAFPHAYFFTRSLFTPAQAQTLLRRSPQVKSPWNGSPAAAWLARAAQQAYHMDSFAAISWLESRSYLVSTLLRDTDSMSMAHSLEVRVPFLDHPLFEFVLGLPEKFKRLPGPPKALLRAAMRDCLAPEIIAQPKRTFTFPWKHWLRGPLQSPVATSLQELHPALAQVLDHSEVQSVWRGFLAGRTSWSRPWSLYILNEWCLRHLHRATTAPPKAAALAG